MTGQRLKKRFRDSASTIRTQQSEWPDLSPRYGDMGLYVSSDHPEDGIRIKVQSEMDGEAQRLTDRRFHCFSLTASEFTEFIQAPHKAFRVARSLAKEYRSSNGKHPSPNTTPEATA